MNLKNGLVALLSILSLTTFAQAPQPTKTFTITGKVKSFNPGGKVYLESNGQPSVRLDSTTIDKEGRFTLKSGVPVGGTIYILSVNDQKVALLVEGDETLNATIDGYRENLKTKQKGVASVTGSKNMQYYQQIMTLTGKYRIPCSRLGTNNIRRPRRRKTAKKFAEIEQQIQYRK